MVRLKVLCCAYREWAKNVFSWVISEANLIEHKISFFEAETPEMAERIFDDVRPDLILFYGWSWKVPDKIINGAECWCLHPSILPLYRGGSPLQHQIIKGEKSSAVSIFRMTGKIDGGPLKTRIPFLLNGSLYDIFDRISRIAMRWTLCALIRMANGETIKEYPQEGDSSMFNRRTPEQSEITIEEIKGRTSTYIFNKVRALSHHEYPAAFIRCGDGKKVKIIKAEIDDAE